MPKYLVTMKDGKKYKVTADSPPTDEEMTAFISKSKAAPPPEKPPSGMWNEIDKPLGSGPLAALLDAPHHLMSQVGNAVTRGAIRLPSQLTHGLPTLAADAFQWGFQGKDWKDTLKETDWLPALSTEATDQAFGDGMGLYSRENKKDWTRYPARAAEFAIQTALSGGTNLTAQLASGGSAVASQAGEDIAPNDPYLSPILGLLGLATGGVPRLFSPKAPTAVPAAELANRAMDGWTVAQPEGGLPKAGPKFKSWAPKASEETQLDLPLGPPMEQQLSLNLPPGVKPPPRPMVQGELPFPEQQLPLPLRQPEPVVAPPKVKGKGGRKAKGKAAAPKEPVQGELDTTQPFPNTQTEFGFKFPEEAPRPTDGTQGSFNFSGGDRPFPSVQDSLFDLGKPNFTIPRDGYFGSREALKATPDPVVGPASADILKLQKGKAAEQSLTLMKAVDDLPKKAAELAKKNKTPLVDEFRGLLDAITPADATSPIAKQIARIHKVLPKDNSLLGSVMEPASHGLLHLLGLGKAGMAWKIGKTIYKSFQKPGAERLAAEMDKLKDIASSLNEPRLAKPKQKSIMPAILPALTN